MNRPTWLEVALNGPWSRDLQPGIPVKVDDIVADGIRCAQAGAAIIHVHAYDEATGRQKDDPEIYARIIEGIREAVDVIVYPTIPFAGSGDAPDAGDDEKGAARFAAIRGLAERGLLEWAVVDPGTVNLSRFDDLTAGRNGFVYANPDPHIRAGLDVANNFGFHPAYAIYEPGFARAGAHLARQYPNVPVPIYRFMFSDGFTFGFPPAVFALEAYLRLLERLDPGAPWLVGGLAVDIAPLIERTVTKGGHLRVGLEDAPFGTEDSNLAIVERAVAMIEDFGGTLASAADIRAALKAVSSAA